MIRRVTDQHTARPWGRITAALVAAAFTVTPTSVLAQAVEDHGVQRLDPVPFTSVRFTDRFWAPRIETNRRVTIPYDFQKCEETGRISNFEKAGGHITGEFEGIYYNDSDVYKVIEGAAYSLAQQPDPDLEAYLDALIAKIAAAQEDDGYLNTYHTLVTPDRKWTDIRVKHELYCAGHLIEAAVAHHQATGKRNLLDVAIRLADHIDSVFGEDGKHEPPGHQEIEIALVKLADETGEQRYFDLAEFFVDQRGRGENHELYGPYAQDHLPVGEQHEPVGHAVRAMYLYAGMADIAARSGNEAWLDALNKLWEHTVEKKMYLTGGVGATSHGEAFGQPYELPNASAYNETCAAIGHAMWNHRMGLLHADAKYIDILERTIYNGFLSGVSLSGDRFFYPNPLASRGTYHRSPWFSTSCCPVNVVRFVPSIPGYAYAQREHALFVNLFAQSEASLEIAGGTVSVRQITEYPWSGEVEIIVTPDEPCEFSVHVRIPGWAQGDPVPGDLYAYRNGSADKARLVVNGTAVSLDELNSGYAVITRTWNRGDVIKLSLPMPVRVVESHPEVEANRGRIAIERGPIVYCMEGVDAGGYVRNIWLPESIELTPMHEPQLLGGITALRGTANAQVQHDPEGDVLTEKRPIQLIPYYAWDHRAACEMAVWLPTSAELVEVVPPPTIASRATARASHCFQMDTVDAINDQLEPANSIDHSIPRHTFWPRKGTTEWVQLDLAQTATVNAAEVYWFDDTGRGECRVPKSWRLLYRDGDAWKPVELTSGAYDSAKDRFNRVEFAPVRTAALRIEVELEGRYSGGVLEWRLEGE